MHCRSMQTAEHIASIFSIGTLFILCNPDKVRSQQDVTTVGWQCQKWPMTLACGYGRPVPSNRFLAFGHSEQKNGEDALIGCAPLIPLLMCGTTESSAPFCDGASGACGACGKNLC